jgi:hypothetical protein
VHDGTVETINCDCYVNDILNPFLNQPIAEGRWYGYFQQDNPTVHMANETMAATLEVFEDRIISRGLWPHSSPDLLT